MCVCMYMCHHENGFFSMRFLEIPSIKTESFMWKQMLSTVFTTSHQIGERSRGTFKWIIDWKAGKWNVAWEKCNSQSSSEQKPLPQMMQGRCTVHNLLVQRSWTAVRCHGAAGGWDGGDRRWWALWSAVTKLLPLKIKLSLATLKCVWESRASQVTLAQFFFFRVPSWILMTVDHAKGHEKSHRSRQSAGMEAANMFPSQIRSSYGLFCKAPQI